MKTVLLRFSGRSLKTMSSGVYDVYRNKVREFGLDFRRGHRYCSSSPDGAFALMKRNSSRRYNLLGICILEMKTRGNEHTTNKLFELRNGPLLRELLSNGALLPESYSTVHYCLLMRRRRIPPGA